MIFLCTVRKCLLIFCVVFFSKYGAGTAAVLCTLVLLCALTAHSQYMPYTDYHIDLLEKSSIFCNIVTLVTALLFEETSLGPSAHFGVVVVISLTNSFFFVMAGYM